jgi:hypothetical protein
VALALLGLVLCVSVKAVAHELAVDQLRLWRAPGEDKLLGQLTFDPELTRKLDEALPPGEAERRVVAFVQSELSFAVDARPLRFRAEVRELYVKGGAVPGDIVMLEAHLPPAARELVVRTGASFKALLVAVDGSDGSDGVQLLGGESTPPFALRASPSAAGSTRDPRPQVAAAPSTFSRFVLLGFRHILPDGWDHVLFVCGLVLGSGGRIRRLMLELLAFTVAHTLTLGLGAANWIVVPARVVEPLIALSISYVAVENLMRRELGRSRLWVVLAFGLLHGQGFAGALSETPLSAANFLVALFSFNLGVELGQATVVAALCAFLLLLKRPETLLPYVARPGSIAIAAIGLYWGVARLAG